MIIYSIEPKDVEKLFGQLSSFEIEKGRDLEGGDKYKAIIGARFNEIFEKRIGLGSKIGIEEGKYKNKYEKALKCVDIVLRAHPNHKKAILFERPA